MATQGAYQYSRGGCNLSSLNSASAIVTPRKNAHVVLRAGAARSQRPGWEARWGEEELARTSGVQREGDLSIGTHAEIHPAYAGERQCCSICSCIGGTVSLRRWHAACFPPRSGMLVLVFVSHQRTEGRGLSGVYFGVFRLSYPRSENSGRISNRNFPKPRHHAIDTNLGCIEQRSLTSLDCVSCLRHPSSRTATWMGGEVGVRGACSSGGSNGLRRDCPRGSDPGADRSCVGGCSPCLLR